MQNERVDFDEIVVEIDENNSKNFSIISNGMVLFEINLILSNIIKSIPYS